MYDALTRPLHLRVPDARGEPRRGSRPSASSTGSPGRRIRPSTSVRFACPCGDEHVGLVTHDELDWAPLGLGGGVFLNLMTSRLEPLGDRARRPRRAADRGGRVALELLLLPGGAAAAGLPVGVLRCSRRATAALGVAVRCPACATVSVNLVSPSHVDLPFHHDREIGVVEHVFAEDADGSSRSSARSSRRALRRAPPLPGELGAGRFSRRAGHRSQVVPDIPTGRPVHGRPSSLA